MLGICPAASSSPGAGAGRPGESDEIGWIDVAPTPAATGDPARPPQPADRRLPVARGRLRAAGAALATNERSCQAFRYATPGRQFHPEVDFELFEVWSPTIPAPPRHGLRRGRAAESVRRGSSDQASWASGPALRRSRGTWPDGTSSPLGCATGIGNAGARAVADRGDRLALGDIDAGGVETRAAGLREHGADDRAFALDAADAAAVRRFVVDGATALGGLDAAWSNVGVQIAGTAEDVTVEQLDRSWAINVRAHAVLCGAAIPHLRAAGGGAILVTASNSALISEPRLLPYATTKAAALALAKQIARDYAPERIRVNALCPGWVDTPFNEPAWANFGGREVLEAMLASCRSASRPRPRSPGSPASSSRRTRRT